MQTEPGQYAHNFKVEIKKNLETNYLLYLPEEYKTSAKEWPLILFLHGAGERGNNLEKVKVWGPPKIVEKDKNFPFIVISPQCPEGDWWTSFHQLEVLNTLVDNVVKNYNVDKSRIYLTGLSMGGYGTWALACEFPDKFAAIAPICGGGEPRVTRKIKHIPTWVFHGKLDNVVPLQESENMVSALKKYGGNVKLTIYPEANHNSWSKAYNESGLFEWFLEHKK